MEPGQQTSSDLYFWIFWVKTFIHKKTTSYNLITHSYVKTPSLSFSSKFLTFSTGNKTQQGGNLLNKVKDFY